MRSPAIIFDFGNVIAFFDYGKAATKLAAYLGVSGEGLFDRLRPSGFTELHQDFERGQISAINFSQKISAMIGMSISHDEFAAAWNDIFTPNDSLIPVITKLKAEGYRLILGSNTNVLQATYFREQFASTLAHFDALILSHEIQRLKPDQEFYRACTKAANLPPGECLFIDDLAENIEGARAAGLQGLVYQSTDLLITHLNRLGIKIEQSSPP